MLVLVFMAAALFCACCATVEFIAGEDVLAAFTLAGAIAFSALARHALTL